MTSKADDMQAKKHKATENFLKAVGLMAMPVSDREEFIQHVRQTLQMRVGQQIAKFLTQEELKQFQSYMDAQKNQEAMEFLNSKVPSHSEIVHQEMVKLQAEIKADAPKILETFKK